VVTYFTVESGDGAGSWSMFNDSEGNPFALEQTESDATVS